MGLAPVGDQFGVVAVDGGDGVKNGFHGSLLLCTAANGWAAK